MSVGFHEYYFEFLLPYELPTSFVGKFGRIQYSAIVGMDVSMRLDKKFEFPFTLIKPINLNYDATWTVSFSINAFSVICSLLEPSFRFQEPVNLVDKFVFFPFSILCCLKSDPVEITARLPVSGFIPGQTINLQFDAKNNSDRPILDFKVQLQKVSSKSDFRLFLISYLNFRK